MNATRSRRWIQHARGRAWPVTLGGRVKLLLLLLLASLLVGSLVLALVGWLLAAFSGLGKLNELAALTVKLARAASRH